MILGSANLKLFIQNLRNYHRYFRVSLVFLAGVGLSAYAALVVYKWEQKNIQIQWQTQLDKISTSLQRDLSRNIDLLQAIRGFFMASDTVEIYEFETFTNAAIYRNSGIEAIAWLPRIFDQERLDFEQTVSLTEFSNSGEILNAKQRTEYFPISYIVPLDSHQSLIGLDLQATPSLEALLKRAATQNEIVATKLRPVENYYPFEAKILVFIPIYYHNLPEKFSSKNNHLIFKQNYQNLRGFIMGVFQPKQIFQTALESSELESNINVYLQDIISSEKELIAFYQTSTKQIIDQKNSNLFLEKGTPASCLDGSACTRILNVENRRWLLRLRLAPGYTDWHKSWRSWATLFLGSVIAGLISTYLLTLFRYTDQIEKAISERIAESKNLEKALEELQRTQSQLVQIEKMSSLGQLVAGVAHEINNPVNFIAANLHYAKQYTEELIELIKLYQKHNSDPSQEIIEYHETIDLNFLQQDFAKIIQSMEVGTERINKIVLSLKNFSRLDESGLKAINVHEGLETSLVLLEHRLNQTLDSEPIQIFKNYADLPLIECYPAELNQVFMNILANAIDALESRYISCNSQTKTLEKPWISLQTEILKSDFINVRIADNGLGMNELVQKKLFDPFFTTKSVGKGTGLGLAISYHIIVVKHGGFLEFESVLGQGTEFRIQIPLTQKNN